jgi:hypothetical protein
MLFATRQKHDVQTTAHFITDGEKEGTNLYVVHFPFFGGLHFKNRHFQNSLFSRFSVFHFFFNFSILSSQWTWIWDGCWERSDKKSKGTELISTSNRVRERRVVIRRVGVESNLSVFISSDGVYICAKKKAVLERSLLILPISNLNTHT